MEDKIKQVLEKYGLTESQLTKEELEKLKEEIVAKEQGFEVLDGVLATPSLYYRKKETTILFLHVRAEGLVESKARGQDWYQKRDSFFGGEVTSSHPTHLSLTYLLYVFGSDRLIVTPKLRWQCFVPVQF